MQRSVLGYSLLMSDEYTKYSEIRIYGVRFLKVIMKIFNQDHKNIKYE